MEEYRAPFLVAVLVPRMTTIWTPVSIPAHALDLCRLPDSGAANGPPIDNDFWFWDFAPVVDADGASYMIGDHEIWLALSAPRSSDPSDRHFVASLAVLYFSHGNWEFVGELNLRGIHPGNREWAGMAVVRGSTLQVFFTSAGSSGYERGYQQRLWLASCPATTLEDPNSEQHWADAREILAAADGPYLPAHQQNGEPGMIRAYRDPFYFVAGEDRSEYVVFTASYADTTSRFNGAVGLARLRRSTGSWDHLGPVIVSDNVATELERAHIVKANGLYYVFWSTPAYAFRRELGYPTGLYGAVSERLDGGFRMLNEHGLVLANPAERPHQQYSWYVSGDFAVQGFVDLPDYPSGRPDKGAPDQHERFAGTAGPRYSILLDGNQARVRMGAT